MSAKLLYYSLIVDLLQGTAVSFLLEAELELRVVTALKDRVAGLVG